MGAGASTGGKGKKKKEEVSSAKYLEKAADSAAEATALFKQLDTNEDNMLSWQELSEAIKAHKDLQKNNWSDALVAEVVYFYDRDGNGMLDMEEFTAALVELKARGGQLDTPELQERAAKRAEYKAVWDKHSKAMAADVNPGWRSAPTR